MSAGPDVRTLAVTTHGRYLVDVPAGAGPWPVLLGFHGYAETAGVHHAQLARLDPAHRWLRVSVQGLHRFYTRQQDVVASWMTREDRELALADNIARGQLLHKQTLEHLDDVVAVLAALACLPLWLQALPQRNGHWIALLLPIHAALARAWPRRAP